MKHFIGRFSKFVSDGSDFVIGADDGSNKRGLARITAIASCLIPSFGERRRHEKILADELKTNTLFREGWNKAKLKIAKKGYLKENDFLALYTYTLEVPRVYSEFNKKTLELGPNNPNYDFKAMYYFLSAAIHAIKKKTPQGRPYKVYRGVSYPVTAQVGQPFHFNSFTSTSGSRSVAEKFLPNRGGTLFIIESYLGGKIGQFSAFPGEDEVLVPPCEKFKVLKVLKNVRKGRQEIHLKSLGMIA